MQPVNTSNAVALCSGFNFLKKGEVKGKLKNFVKMKDYSDSYRIKL